MSNDDGSFPNIHRASNWNVVRSKTVPSGASGIHKIAKPTIAGTTDESLLKPEERMKLRSTKSTAHFHTAVPIGIER